MNSCRPHLRTLMATFFALLLLAGTACTDDPTQSGGQGASATPGAVGPNGQPSDPNTPVAPGDPATSSTGGGATGFNDITAAAGIRFKHNSGAFGKKYLPETMGSGCAFLDYDNDGWQDVLLVNSTNWPEQKGAKTPSALYHNNHDGTFTDVTEQAGLGAELYGLGCAVADFDNDGLDDVYITALGANKLFRNQGGGRFADVTAKAGVGDPGFSTSAAWFDYDKDGKLDLFVCNYVTWTVATDVRCSLDGKNKSYCTPELYKGQSPTLYHNRGNGTFEDVTKRAGLYDPSCKSLGVALIDFDANGWMDLFVANDTQPNKLYKNNGNGTFEDIAIEAGVAFSDAGTPRAGMGVDAADFDGSGRQGLVLGNFTNEMMSLYKNDGSGLFTDEGRTGALGKTSAQSVTFACFFFDYDLDGLLDVLAVNGHVADDIATVQPQLSHAQTPFLFRNTGGGSYVDSGAQMGPIFRTRIVGRGAAFGDIDNDGDLDVLVTENNGAPRLLRNDGASRNNAVRVKLVGVASNRDAVGAVITAQTTAGTTLKRMVKTGSSYCSQSEFPVTIGLGVDGRISSLQIAWPSGRVESLPALEPNQRVTIQEGVGIVAAEPLTR